MATGDTLAAWNVFSNEPLDSSSAALRAQITVTGDYTLPCIKLPASGSPGGVLSGKLLNYAGGGITVRLLGAMDGTNTGTPVVRVEAALARQNAGEVLTGGGFASAQVAESIVDNTANSLFIATIGFTHGAQMDSVVNGDWFRLRYARLNAGLSGTNASGAMQWIYADIVEA